MIHETVLLNESIEYLKIKPNGVYVDATFGGGGHSRLILSHLKEGKLFGFDQDYYAVTIGKKFELENKQFTIIHDNFSNIKKRLEEHNIHQIDGILMDLGMSSFQIDDASRGFSYMHDAPLDMRMNKDNEKTAKDILNTYSKEALAEIFFVYGEEKNSFKIASRIIDQRPIETTSQLVKITDAVNYNAKGHSAKKVFQALRIEVNNELAVLKQLLSDARDLLSKDGRMVALTFHSLEDRIVKHFFKENEGEPIPKGLPITGGKQGVLEVLTRKPVYPSEQEQKHNSRSRSAKLRAAIKK